MLDSVEQYNTQVLSHEITRDEEMWNNVIRPGLEEFCRDLNQCLVVPDTVTPESRKSIV
jgi:hypothetical protein